MLPLKFISLAILALTLAAIIIGRHQSPARAVSIFAIAAMGWLGYTYLLSQSGFLANFSMPPRLPLTLILPAILATLFITGRPAFASILQRTPIHLPVLLQSFRILVEWLIYESYLSGLLPREVTFEGYNFDMVVGVSALFAGMLAWRGKAGKRVLVTWNIFGLLILAFTAFTFMRSYFGDGIVTQAQRDIFIRFPYILVAAVMLPVAVGMHIVSIRQLLQKKEVWQFHQRPHATPASSSADMQII